MKNYLSDYTAYMRHLAEQHRELRHTEGDRHFFRGELQEFFENLRSRVNFPCLVVESSEVEYGGERSNPYKQRTTSFIVADSYDQVGDYNEMEYRMSICERIAEQLLGRMMNDREKPFRFVKIEEASGEYLANEAQRYVGYRITLSFSDNVCLTDKNAFDDEAD